MLPPSHVAYTLLAVDWLRQRIPALKSTDYRLMALAATGPDLIDKPLAVLYFYRRYKSAVLFAHTLLAHLTVFGLVWRFKPTWLAYVLAFNGHAILDRLWFFPKTWYWPFLGWKFHVWDNQQSGIKEAYWHAFTRRPELIIWEVGGLVAGLVFVWRHRLYEPTRLLGFLRDGRLPRHEP